MINRAPACLDSSQVPLYNQGACTQSLPGLSPCSVQIRDGSLTHTAERLKTTISPFSYPRQPQFLTLSLPRKRRRLLRSNASPRRLWRGGEVGCNSLRIVYSCMRLIGYRNHISNDPPGYVRMNSVLTQQNRICLCGKCIFG